jgi:hypothetical protein
MLETGKLNIAKSVRKRRDSKEIKKLKNTHKN